MGKAADINAKYVNKRRTKNVRKQFAKLHGKKSVSMVVNPTMSKKGLKKKKHLAKMLARESDKIVAEVNAATEEAKQAKAAKTGMTD